MDPFLLARIQFAANITFHILFPTITIALAWFLLFFKLQYNRTQKTVWMDLYALWVKIFALCFALGVVSGITMSFQFGTNWPGFMETVGNIAGPLLAYEVLTAFFLEATFLGIMLYGMNRVSDRIHTIATLLVAIGTSASAFWILVLNSWMQTPTGYKIINHQAHVDSWMQIIFNPSMPYRMIHMLIASGLTACFLIAGLSAYQFLRNKNNPIAKLGLRVSLIPAAILIPIQILVGDLHGLNTLKYQPAKIAAIEAIWETEQGADLRLFAIPDPKQHKNHYELKIPKLASVILTHSPNGTIQGLNSFKHAPHNVPAIFWAFRMMVGTGILMLLTAWFGLWHILRKKIFSDGFAKILVLMTGSGWLATLAGWYTTEIGRQPWLVTNILLTKDAVAKTITTPLLLSSLTLYLSVYSVLIVSFISVIFYLAGKPTGKSK